MLKRCLIVCGIATVLCVAVRHNGLDDALIYARYIRNAVAGRGLVFNVGERVNALTSPLLAAILLATSWLMRGHVLVAEMTVSTCFMAGACIMAEQFAPWAGMLIASTSYFYLCFGMETTLFLFLITLTLLLYIKGRLGLIPLLALLTFLTRFEGGLLGAVIAYDMFRKRTFPQLRSWIAPVVVFAAYMAFNLHFYGHVLPASASAKFGQGLSGYWGRWPRAFLHPPGPLYKSFYRSIYVIPLALVFGVLGVRAQRGSTMNLILLPFLGGLLAFYVLFNIPNYHWYDAPFVFFILIYAVIGLPKTRLTRPLLAAAILECTIVGFLGMYRLGSMSDYAQAGQWLEAHSSANAKVAAAEIGTIGWNCDRNVDDILGLTNPKNAVLLSHRDTVSWLEQDKPDYVVVHASPWFAETVAVTSPLYTYEPVHFGQIYLMRRKDSTK